MYVLCSAFDFFFNFRSINLAIVCARELCLCVYMCIMCVLGVHRGHLGLELLVVVSIHVGPEKETKMLCKSKKCP